MSDNASVIAMDNAIAQYEKVTGKKVTEILITPDALDDLKKAMPADVLESKSDGSATYRGKPFVIRG